MDYRICKDCPRFHESEDVSCGKDVSSCRCKVNPYFEMKMRGDKRLDSVRKTAFQTKNHYNWVRNLEFNVMEMTDKDCEYFVEHMVYDCNQKKFRKVASRTATWVFLEMNLLRRLNVHPIFILYFFILLFQCFSLVLQILKLFMK